MRCTEVLKARVTPELKDRVRAIAEREMLTETAWLKRLVLREVQAISAADEGHVRQLGEARRSGQGATKQRVHAPVLVRLRHEDRLLLAARAEARGMRAASYSAVLIRSHLRQIALLPDEEYRALKQSISELVAIGRNLNQIARLANQAGRAPSSGREEFRAMLKICESLRDNTKALLAANSRSWKIGHGEDI